MTAPVEELLRRAQVMRQVRLVVAALVPVEMLLYVPPPGVPSPLRPVAASVVLASALLAVNLVSWRRHREPSTPERLTTVGRLEVCADAGVTLAVLQLFAFDQFSAMWTILLIVVLEGAFREGLRGAMLTWASSGLVYAGIQVLAAHSYPGTAPLDPGSILFRALVTGAVAFVAGSLASQLQSALERHRGSEAALAGQYADLRLIGRVSRAIAAGPQARREVCRAVGELSGAELVMLWEPDEGALRCTAAAGIPHALLPPLELADETSGAVRAYRTGRLQLAVDAVLPKAFDRTTAKIRCASAAFVPVVRDGRAVATLVLTFPQRTEQLSERVLAALDVLAEEAAVAIIRADLTDSLTSEARRDQLTGLVNRRGLEESLETEMLRARRTTAPLTVLMLDLDGLKVFNDTHGHLAGDRLIADSAAGWQGRLRPTDVLARYGGDEFVAVLPGCDETRAMTVADALLAALPPGGACSVGAATWNHAEDAATLLARADDALYSGKRAGGGRVVCALSAVPPPRRAVDDRVVS
jgi:diguanylate cyclase (GGDEF)-like protein